MFISCFLVNQISFNLLDDIQETELKELIPSLKERIIFKRGLNKLKNIIRVSTYSCFFFLFKSILGSRVQYPQVLSNLMWLSARWTVDQCLKVEQSRLSVKDDTMRFLLFRYIIIVVFS